MTLILVDLCGYSCLWGWKKKKDWVNSFLQDLFLLLGKDDCGCGGQKVGRIDT